VITGVSELTAGSGVDVFPDSGALFVQAISKKHRKNGRQKFFIFDVVIAKIMKRRKARRLWVKALVKEKDGTR